MSVAPSSWGGVRANAGQPGKVGKYSFACDCGGTKRIALLSFAVGAELVDRVHVSGGWSRGAMDANELT